MRRLRRKESVISSRVFQARAFDGLREIVVGAAFDCFDCGIERVETRHEDHVDAGVALERLLQEREAVHGGHAQVAQDDATAALADHVQRALRVGGAHGLAAEALDGGAEYFDQGGVVVQDADG